MALIKCTECGNDVSDAASVCPKCGYPIAEITQQSRNSMQQTLDDWRNGRITTEEFNKRKSALIPTTRGIPRIFQRFNEWRNLNWRNYIIGILAFVFGGVALWLLWLL